MAHHQRHGPDYDAQISRSLMTRPTSPHTTSMPSISEDEQLAETDEPPEPTLRSPYVKHAFAPTLPRRQSLLTKALHTDSESHDDEALSPGYFRKASIPSVSSTYSIPSTGFTSDEGRVSPSTRPSTPGSPRSVMSIPKTTLPQREAGPLPTVSCSTDSHLESDTSSKTPQSPEKEAEVEAKLGRKRCIMFACGGSKTNTTIPSNPPKPEESKDKPTAILKRPCTIKFACPFKVAPDTPEGSGVKKSEAIRRLSPAPQSTPALVLAKRHRDSDSTTLNGGSPTTPRATMSNASPRRFRRFSNQSDIARGEACRFHEFASGKQHTDDWTQESTCHKMPLTVSDTLQKENAIRRLAEEADEEEALDDELEGLGQEDDDEDDLSSEGISDTGFQTDDEEGFAASDDGSASDSDYEWWAPRKSRARSPYVGHDIFRPIARTCSNSSLESDDGTMSVKTRSTRGKHGNKRTRPMQIRPGTPELPDSTDFVCGTLDEDRPMETAYASCMEQRKAAKHRVCPQDIDPSFPLSDPEIGSDDEEAAADLVDESEQYFMHGRPDAVSDEGDEEPRGRRMTISKPDHSPVPSPKRYKSPQLKVKKSCAQHRSPAPISIFNHSSPRRMRSPPPPGRLSSPPPSRRGSAINVSSFMDLSFLGARRTGLTHTASLPRSPHRMARRNREFSPSTITRLQHDEDDGNASDRTVGNAPYTRGAIDISQGLERKRLKRREKFYQRYLRKEEKKERKGRTRPCPGKGAERMRKIGLDCAEYRGGQKMMLSI